jgi:hypothetical protein
MSKEIPVLLSTAYLPPIQYMSKLLLPNPVFFEKHENYQKQSYRNRCCIYGANGKQCLVIPVLKQHGEKTPISEVKIDYTKVWQKIHLKAIESAYRLSAFYEYYAADFIRMYERRTKFLFDWNMDFLTLILDLLSIKIQPSVTLTYMGDSIECIDFRSSIHPKARLNKPDQNFKPYPYQQVFQERYGFIPNLSIIDLLFNEGPHALGIIQK